MEIQYENIRTYDYTFKQAVNPPLIIIIIIMLGTRNFRFSDGRHIIIVYFSFFTSRTVLLIYRDIYARRYIGDYWRRLK